MSFAKLVVCPFTGLNLVAFVGIVCALTDAAISQEIVSGKNQNVFSPTLLAAQESFQKSQDGPDEDLGDLVDIEQRRLDYQWAGQLHYMANAIEKGDIVNFERIRNSIAADQKGLMPAQIDEQELLLGYFTRLLKSPETATNELAEQWRMQPDRNWQWDTLFAFHDALESLSSEDKPLRQHVWSSLVKKFAQLDELHDERIIVDAELARYAFRYARRIPGNQLAVAECERLLRKLPEDFGLATVLSERCSLLFKDLPNEWRERYRFSLVRFRNLLLADAECIARHPLALPKVLWELSRLQDDSEDRIALLSSVLVACTEAGLRIEPNAKADLAASKLQRRTLARTKANALLDGYRVLKNQKPIQDNPIHLKYARRFETITLIEALDDLVKQLPSDAITVERLRLTHSLVSVLFDQLLESNKDPAFDVPQVEQRFLRQLDESKRLIALLSRTDKFDENFKTIAEEFEVAWSEWYLKNALSEKMKLAGGRSLLATEIGEITEPSFLDRLKPIETSSRDSLKRRAVLAVGSWHLMQGSYGDAIKSLSAANLDKEFTAHVIKCLVYKDSGDIVAAESEFCVLKGLLPMEEPSVREFREWIIEFLRAEISIDKDEPDAESISRLSSLLKNPASKKLVQNESLAKILKLTNEHHQAIQLVKENRREDAIGIWTRHFTSDHSLFIRIRSAYFLLETNFSHGTAEIALNRSKLEELASNSQKELADYQTMLKGEKSLIDIQESLEAIHSEFECRQAFVIWLQKMSLADGAARFRCTEALRLIFGSDKYPSLRYNVLCLALRIYLLSPDVEFERELERSGWPLATIAEKACALGLQQRHKLFRTGEETDGDPFDRKRDILFERYRDAFDLAVELAVYQGDFDTAARIAAQTSNQSIVDLLLQTESDKSASQALTLEPLPDLPFLSFYVGRERTHVFWRIADGETAIHHHQANIPRTKVVATIDDYVKNYLSVVSVGVASDSAFDNAKNFFYAVFSKKLRAQLELALQAQPAKCVYVIPHGPFFRLPLDTLPIGGNARACGFLLGQCPPLIYLPSITAYGVPESGHFNPFQAELLTIRPDLDLDIGEEIKKLKDLFAEESTTHLDQHGNRISTLPVDDKAGTVSSDTVLEEFERGYRYIYFSGHGTAKAGEQSADVGAKIRLWGKMHLSAMDVLKRFRSTDRNPLRAELVFLAACETQMSNGESLRYGGNTINAMGTSFLVSGAQNVVASHWSVNAKSTSKLAEKFMQQVHRLGLKAPLSTEEYAAILHEARRSVSEDPEFRYPFDWGPFTLSSMLQQSSSRP